MRGVNKFPVGMSVYALYNMESLINKFATKYVWFYNLFKARYQGQLHQGVLVWKGSRTTVLNHIARNLPFRFLKNHAFSCSIIDFFKYNQLALVHKPLQKWSLHCLVYSSKCSRSSFVKVLDAVVFNTNLCINFLGIVNVIHGRA